MQLITGAINISEQSYKILCIINNLIGIDSIILAYMYPYKLYNTDIESP